MRRAFEAGPRRGGSGWIFAAVLGQNPRVGVVTSFIVFRVRAYVFFWQSCFTPRPQKKAH